MAGWLLFSPALLILWAPGGFRLTCYYYRGAYYKAFWADPPACTVGEPRKTYWGERSFPLIMQNVHRYFLYLALYLHCDPDNRRLEGALVCDPATGQSHSGSASERSFSPSTSFCWAATLRLPFAAASDRWISRSTFATSPACYRAYACVSCLNRRHMLWAWMSLFWVGFADLYVRLCSMGVWHDFGSFKR